MVAKIGKFEFVQRLNSFTVIKPIELSFCRNTNFPIPLTLQPDGVRLRFNDLIFFKHSCQLFEDSLNFVL